VGSENHLDTGVQCMAYGMNAKVLCNHDVVVLLVLRVVGETCFSRNDIVLISLFICRDFMSNIQ
jgi:hypothetical protein